MKLNKALSKVVGATLSLALTGSLIVSTHSAYAASNNVLTSAEAQQIITQAEQLKGKVQYHFGVDNPSKLWFDCSSFTKYLFKQEGINLRWGSRLQYEDEMKISRSELRPGDLVFFSTPRSAGNSTTLGKIAHVGIYIGNGEIIHNVSPKYDVLISSINSGWWNTHYIAAARVMIPDVPNSGKVVRSVSFLDSPSLHGNRIRYLATGETFTILSQVNSYWYKIKDHNGQVGYVTTLSKYVSVDSGSSGNGSAASSGSTSSTSSSSSSNGSSSSSSNSSSASTPAGTGKVVRSVSFLDSPSLHGHRYRYLATGETFTILDKVNRYWYKIKDHNGQVGYVTTWTKFVTVESVSSGNGASASTDSNSPYNAASAGTGKAVHSVAFLDSPSLHGHRYRYLATGETFTILDKVNRYWYKIKDHNGQVGYVTTLTKYVSA